MSVLGLQQARGRAAAVRVHVCLQLQNQQQAGVVHRAAGRHAGSSNLERCI